MGSTIPLLPALAMSKLRIAEIFSSIQGEGMWVGTPSTFVRVSGCNLRCVWCDTPYASWTPEGDAQGVPEIVEEVCHRGISHVVLTGGEPMLFDLIEELAGALSETGPRVTIETAGTLFRELTCDHMSISPKLSNSYPGDAPGPGWGERHERVRLDRSALRRLVERYEFQLKFVVDPETGDDLAEVEEIVSGLGDIPGERIMLMAEGTDSGTQLRRQRLLVEPCLARGWRLSPRLHIDLFGNARGT